MSFLNHLTTRYATKLFDSTRTVSDTDLDQILEAIRMTPTSFGAQPFHFYIIKNPAIQSQLEQASYGQKQVSTASHVIVFAARNDVSAVTDEYFDLLSGGSAEARVSLKGYEDMMRGFIARLESSNESLAWSAKQAYIAQGFALAALAELEIDSCPMEGFDTASVSSILDLPANQSPVLLLPIGYRAGSESPRPKFRRSKESLFTFIG